MSTVFYRYLYEFFVTAKIFLLSFFSMDYLGVSLNGKIPKVKFIPYFRDFFLIINQFLR